MFALHPAQGDFPPYRHRPQATCARGYQDIFSAFNWAERYQMPIIVLSDKKMAAIYTTIDKLELKYDTIDRGSASPARNGPRSTRRDRMTVTPGANGDAARTASSRSTCATR